jgi:hypothetical protein
MSRSTSRRATPLVDPNHLRDHADEARIARVWERIERNLQPKGPARLPEPAQARRWTALAIAASVASFVAGFGADYLLREHGDRTERAPLVAAADTRAPDVFAAGAARREYSLPGGGRITVEPNSIVDTKSNDGSGLTLNLVRGEASLSTEGMGGGADRSTPLSLVVGSAQVVTRSGELHVTRRGEVADMEVLRGSADITSPDFDLGAKSTTLRSREILTVPLHLRTAEIVAPVSTVRRRGPAPREGERPLAVPVAPAGSGWRERCAQGDFAGAYEMLRQQPGGAQALVANANGSDLMCISDAYRKGGGDILVVQGALLRLSKDFPSTELGKIATLQVARLFEHSGRLDQARIYYDRYRGLSPDAPLTDDALCQMILGAAQTGDRDAVKRFAQEYEAKYPDGPCIEDIKQLLAESPAMDAGAPGAERASDAGAPAVDGGRADDGPGKAQGKDGAPKPPGVDAGPGEPPKH